MSLIRKSGAPGFFSQLTAKEFGRIVIVSVSLGFLALLIAGGAAAWAVKRDQEMMAWVTHSHRVEKEISDLLVMVERVEVARRGYILSRDLTFVETYRVTREELFEHLSFLGDLTADNARHQTRLQEIRQILNRYLASSQNSIRAVQSGAQAAAVRMFQADRSREDVRRMRALLAEMSDEEAELLKGREAQQRHILGLLYLALGIAAPLLILVALGSTYVIFRYTRDLAGAVATVQRLNAGLEDAVAERTGDLSRANEEIQRFAYIVSHDLRSPLVNVMGFTSELETTVKPLNQLIDRVEEKQPTLLTAEAREAVRVELPEAIRFIRTSTQKMDGLINAILKLSRNGRRVLKAELLDMAAIFQDAASNLAARAQSAGAEIVLDEEIPEVIADRMAVEQIFANLMENAVKYLKADRAGRIEVSGERVGSRVIYSVKDNGRGIDPTDQERIFDLFRRAGVQDQPGEGIGLAHVRALVHRLGGTITCESALDQGAVFRVSLPATAPSRYQEASL